MYVCVAGGEVDGMYEYIVVEGILSLNCLKVSYDIFHSLLKQKCS